MLYRSIHQSVHLTVTFLKIKLLFSAHHYLHPKIFHPSVANVEVNVSVHHVQKFNVEKIPLFKYIVQAIQIFLGNVVINIIALRVGEIEGNIDNINKKKCFCFSI